MSSFANREDLGRFVARRRRELGLTQAALAERMGVHWQSISRWERGQSSPSALDQLADALELQLTELLHAVIPDAMPETAVRVTRLEDAMLLLLSPQVGLAALAERLSALEAQIAQFDRRGDLSLAPNGTPDRPSDLPRLQPARDSALDAHESTG